MSTPYERAVEAAVEAVQPFVPSANWSYSAVADQVGEAAITAAMTPLLASIEALADELDAEARAAESMPCTGMNCGGCARGQDASRLRAALASIKGQPS